MKKRQKVIKEMRKVWLSFIILLTVIGVFLLIFANSKYHGKYYKFTYSDKETLLFNKDIDGDYIILNSNDEVVMYSQMIEGVLKENKVNKSKYEENLKSLTNDMSDAFFKKHRLLLFYEHSDVGALKTKVMAVRRGGNTVYITMSKHSVGSRDTGLTDIYLLPIDKDDDIEGIHFVYKENFAQVFIFSCLLALPYIIAFISIVNFIVRIYDSRLARACDIRRKRVKDAVIQLVIGVVIAVVMYFVILSFVH